MGVVMLLSEKGGVQTPAASAEGSVRSEDPASPMSGNVPGKQDPDGASSRGSFASILDRAGVRGVVPADVGPRVQAGECGQDRGFGLDGESTHAYQVDDSRSESGRELPFTVLKTEADWPEFRDKVVTYSKFYRFEDVLTSEKHIPVGATDIDREVYIRENDVSAALYDRHTKAWAFFNQSFVMRTDIGRIRGFVSQ